MSDKRWLLGFVVKPIMSASRGSLVTQAFILCKRCRCAVSSNSGPGVDAYCLPCALHIVTTHELPE